MQKKLHATSLKTPFYIIGVLVDLKWLASGLLFFEDGHGPKIITHFPPTVCTIIIFNTAHFCAFCFACEVVFFF